MKPIKDPPLELFSPQQQELQKAACTAGIESIEARYRERPSRVEYAYVHCVPRDDVAGRTVGRIAYCHRAAGARWSCEEFASTVETELDGRPVFIQYQFAALDEALAATKYVLSLPAIGTIVPAAWSSSQLNVFRIERFLHFHPELSG